MQAITGMGKYIYAIPIMIFGVFHFMGANDMAGMAPFGGAATIYLTGVCLLAFGISVFIGKYDKLAGVLMAIMLLLFAFILHLPGFLAQEQPAASMFLKDLSMAGAALMYSHHVAKDNSIIG